MHQRLLHSLLLLAAASAAGAAEEPGQDHALVGRFEDSRMVAYDRKAFDEYHLLTEPATEYGGKENNLDSARRLEGTVTRITYESVADASTLEVTRAYRDKLEDNGFEFLFECDDAACGGRDFNHAVVPYDLRFGDNYEDQRYLAARLTRPDEGDVYVMVYTVKGRSVSSRVDVVELEARQRQAVVVSADQMASRIDGDGKVALYGIYFDTDSTAIQSRSSPTLEEIAQLLADDPELRLLVVGHTDDQGGFDYNLDLSRRRAEAVTEALVEDHGISAGRLKPWGVGFVSPVASNRTEDGRARNRRVELVAL